MSRALFITGTDTGCGKTAVGCALARTLRRAGARVRVLKPVETGCAPHPADALALAAAAQDASPLDRLCPYRFRLPASPAVAARAEGADGAEDGEGAMVRLAPIRAALEAARRDADIVLVEGAGGLLVPLAPGLDMAGLAAQLDLPLLIVARASLGTHNHTLLTLEAARSRSLAVAGVAVSHAQAGLSDAERANLDHLIATLPVAFLGELAHGAEQFPDTPAWRRLFPQAAGLPARAWMPPAADRAC